MNNVFAIDEIETVMDPLLFKQERGYTVYYNYFAPENEDKKLRAGKRFKVKLDSYNVRF